MGPRPVVCPCLIYSALKQMCRFLSSLIFIGPLNKIDCCIKVTCAHFIQTAASDPIHSSEWISQKVIQPVIEEKGDGTTTSVWFWIFTIFINSYLGGLQSRNSLFKVWALSQTCTNENAADLKMFHTLATTFPTLQRPYQNICAK